MYAANGRFAIGYLDTLFIAYSAMAGCGLSTVNLSTLTAFQQSVLFVLMLAGHYVSCGGSRCDPRTRWRVLRRR